MASLRETVVESIRRVNQLVGILFEARHLNEQERLHINSQTNTSGKVDQLLGVLGSKQPIAYQCFLKALIDTNQAHVVEHLKNSGQIVIFRWTICYTIPNFAFYFLSVGISAFWKNHIRMRLVSVHLLVPWMGRDFLQTVIVYDIINHNRERKW